MPEITLRHEIECSADTYWQKCFFDEEYNRRLFLDVLKFPGFTLLEQKNEAGTKTKKCKIDPPLVGIPAAAKKVIGDRLSYVEEGALDVKSGRYTFKVIPSAMAEKTTVTGELYTEALGENRIARVAKIKVEVKVFMLGGMVEEKIIGDLKHSYEVAAAFTNDFVKEKGL
jgi:hypothetical protein